MSERWEYIPTDQIKPGDILKQGTGGIQKVTVEITKHTTTGKTWKVDYEDWEAAYLPSNELLILYPNMTNSLCKTMEFFPGVCYLKAGGPFQILC